MARTNIVAVPRIGAYPTAAQISGGAMIPGLTSTSDPTDRSTGLIDGKTSVLAYNSDTVSRTITITSVADTPFNRSGDIVQTLAAKQIALLGPFKNTGWASPGNLLLIDVSDPKVQVAVLTEP